jgi:hypothetical protein
MSFMKDTIGIYTYSDKIVLTGSQISISYVSGKQPSAKAEGFLIYGRLTPPH